MYELWPSCLQWGAPSYTCPLDSLVIGLRRTRSDRLWDLTCVSRLGAHEEEEKERRKTSQDESNVKVLVNVWLKPDQPMPPKLPIERTPVHVGRYVYFVLCSMPLHMNNLFSIEYIVPVDLYAWFKVNQKWVMEKRPNSCCFRLLPPVCLREVGGEASKDGPMVRAHGWPLWPFPGHQKN